jgi:hypothetical protein
MEPTVTMSSGMCGQKFDVDTNGNSKDLPGAEKHASIISILKFTKEESSGYG